MASRLLAVTFDAHDPARLLEFWGALLGRTADGLLLPGDETQVGLGFAANDAPRPGLNALHLHLTSDGPAGQDEVVATARGLGATHLDVGQLPEEGHVVLADPEGNAFCVIEEDNRYLAGCGPLGELACDGSRPVGLFWSAALEWPLVWDQDDETAIQSPLGGTKVAWGGPPDEPKRGRNVQRFDLAPVGDRRAEIDRLIALGATRLSEDELADPEGNEFRLRAN
jgi:hypothetical protein